MHGDIETFDIATLRMWLHGQQQEAFAGGQRLSGTVAQYLNLGDRLLNALALYQGDNDKVVPVAVPTITAPAVSRWAKPDVDGPANDPDAEIRPPILRTESDDAKDGDVTVPLTEGNIFEDADDEEGQ